MTVPRRILILFADPTLRKSRVNQRLLAVAQRVAGVTVRNLYEEYPDCMINVKREQELLEAHKVILKGWLDPVPQPYEAWDTPSLAREVRGERA